MDNSSLNVLILAAGLGTRLRPLTNDVPKPLVPVVDASILDLQARKARAIGNVRLHANAHYLAEQVVEAGNALGFEKVWVEQPEILGTAGPLRRIYAEGYRGGLLVMNGDAYCNFDLRAFVSNAQSLAARPDGPQVALLAVDFPKVNTFRVGEANKKLAMAQANIARADENLRTATLGFKEGVITPTTVMEAQTAWLQAQSQKIDAEIDVRLSQVELQKSLGILE